MRLSNIIIDFKNIPVNILYIIFYNFCIETLNTNKKISTACTLY